METQELEELKKKAKYLRKYIVETMRVIGSAHIGGAFSMMEFMVLLYYRYLRFDAKDPHWIDRDRVILSKGHAGIGLSHILADNGFFDPEELKTFNLKGSRLAMHLNDKVPGVDVSTGSLGHGLPVANGLGMGARIQNKSFLSWCIIGDAECNEGSIWEAAMSIAHYSLTNVITIVDRNNLAMDGNTEDVMGVKPLAKKWESFGFDVCDVEDGHDFDQLDKAFQKAIANSKQEGAKPVVIIPHTVKGKGISFIENNYKWHYGGFSTEDSDRAIAEIEKS